MAAKAALVEEKHGLMEEGAPGDGAARASRVPRAIRILAVTALAAAAAAAGLHSGCASCLFGEFTSLLEQDPPAAKDWYAIRAQATTSSGRVFLSHNGEHSVDLWSGNGHHQKWRITLVADNVYNIESVVVTNGGRTFLSHDGVQKVDLWTDPGERQAWKIYNAPNVDGAYVIEAARNVGRRKYLSHDGDHSLDMWSGAGDNQFWRIPGFAQGPTKNIHEPISPGECADPFVWDGGHEYHMVCTGGNLPHYTGSSIREKFSWAGHMLPLGHLPSWSMDMNHWAPETAQVGHNSFVFYSAPSSGEHLKPHRIGWARASHSSGGAGAWSELAGQRWFDRFPKSRGGEIDPSVYQDVDESGRNYYLLWKTDDNNAGDLVTRLWMQEISFSGGLPELRGEANILLDSTDMWWVGSFTPGGSLIEGPELLKHGGYYYLFFASGRYCKADYAENVARSQSLFGPYEKMPGPVVSTGRVGHVEYKGETPKLVGPGHAGFFKEGGTWYMVWHASPGHNCHRHAFVSALEWGGGWPRMVP